MQEESRGSMRRTGESIPRQNQKGKLEFFFQN